jgi:hypothetical protein
LSLSEKTANWPGFFPYEGEKEKENTFAAPSVEDQSTDESDSLREDLFAQKSEAQNDWGPVSRGPAIGWFPRKRAWVAPTIL